MRTQCSRTNGADSSRAPHPSRASRHHLAGFGRPIRWIVDDVIKFLKREVKRGNKYDAILLDPPSFGRGKKGELFKIEETPHIKGVVVENKEISSPTNNSETSN